MSLEGVENIVSLPNLEKPENLLSFIKLFTSFIITFWNNFVDGINHLDPQYNEKVKNYEVLLKVFSIFEVIADLYNLNRLNEADKLVTFENCYLSYTEEMQEMTLVIKIIFFDKLSYFTKGKLIPNITYIIAHSVNSEEISIKRTDFNTGGNTISTACFNTDTDFTGLLHSLERDIQLYLK